MKKNGLQFTMRIWEQFFFSFSFFICRNKDTMDKGKIG